MKFEVFKRKDGLWAWHVRGGDNEIVADDAAQGYENRADCIAGAKAAAKALTDSFAAGEPDDAA